MCDTSDLSHLKGAPHDPKCRKSTPGLIPLSPYFSGLTGRGVGQELRFTKTPRSPYRRHRRHRTTSPTSERLPLARFSDDRGVYAAQPYPVSWIRNLLPPACRGTPAPL